jgi:Swiss Army Knife RNA repair-like protein
MDGNTVPLLLVDIDGVISLFGFDPATRPPGRFIAVEGIVHYLSAGAGEHLRRLSEGFELVWCSGWEEKANEHLPGALGLSAGLPHLSFERRPASSAHWKLDAIDRYAGPTRPLAWIDDAHDGATRAWAATRPGPTLIVATEPPVGLTEADVKSLMGWAAGLAPQRRG